MSDNPFFKILPDGRFCFFVDATLIKDFAICERRFMFRHIKNLRQKRVKTGQVSLEYISFPISIGGWWSDVMEDFYNHLKDKTPISEKQIQDIAIKNWAKHNLDALEKINPEPFEKFGGLSGAVLMLKDYYDNQYLIDRSTWKIIAAEAGFGLNKEVLVGESNRVVVYWIGKPDLVVIENDRLIPVDHKTVTKIDGRTAGKYKPGPQMPGYCFAVETVAKSLGIDRRVDRAIINICARERPSDKPRDGKKKPRFIRAFPAYNREEIEEWRRLIVSKCERLRQCIQTDVWDWGYQSCHNIFMRECEFLKADSQPPSARNIILMSDFEVGKAWQPYSVTKEKEDD